MKKIILILTMLLTIFLAYYYFYNPDNYTYHVPEYAFDIYDIDQKVDFSTDVFTVNSVKKVKKHDLPQGDVIPITYYEAVVEDSLKGSLKTGNQVLLSQDIGYDKFKKTHITFEGEKYLIDDTAYIISAVYSKDRQSYHIISVTGAEALSQNSNDLLEKYIKAINN